MAAEGIVEAVASRRIALGWHLSSNHFPPVPYVWVSVAEAVIDRLDAGEDPDELIENPVRAGETVTLRQVAEGLHLDPWLDPEED
jgi:hypothetical protein